MENSIFVIIISAILAVLIQYYVIKGAITASLSDFFKNKKETNQNDNLLIIAGLNPSDFALLDKEAEIRIQEELNTLKKDSKYRVAFASVASKMEEDLKFKIQNEYNLKKLELLKK